MILPIYTYGSPVLREKTTEIDKNYRNLNRLIFDMVETMKKSKGVGLAAPQIGLPIRLFITDASAYTSDFPEESEELLEFKKTFINAKILEEYGEICKFMVGCLSIPNVGGDVERKSTIKIKYFDANFLEHTETYSGIRARIIQHEYDHIEGILFTDKVSPLRKRLLKAKLSRISRGKVDTGYMTKFVPRKLKEKDDQKRNRNRKRK